MKNLKQKLIVTGLVLLGCISLDSSAKTNQYIVNAISNITNQSVHGGLCISVPSTHQIYISNPTTHNLHYRIEYITCIGTGCNIVTQYKDISPNQSWTDYYVNKMAYCAHYGKNTIETSAETYIYGEYSSRVKNFAKLEVI